MAAALSLGASAAWIGTRFLASEEAVVHRDYQARLFEAGENDTVYLENLYNIGWSDAPHRVLHNSTVAAWENAGRPAIGARPGEGEVIGREGSGDPLLRYQSSTPSSRIEGDIGAMALYAGQGVGLVKKRQPAAEIVREIAGEAAEVLQNLAP